MLRLITSRRVRLALAAGVLAAVVVAVVHRWRTSEGGLRAGLPAGEAPSGPSAGTDPGAGHAPQWPPAPILGVPTEKDLRRYAVGPPSAFRSAVERVFAPGAPPEPLDGATRSRLVRWVAAGIGLCLLAFGTQVLENAVFAPQTPAVEEIAFGGSRSTGHPCEPGIRDAIEEEPARSYTLVWCTEAKESDEVLVFQDFLGTEYSKQSEYPVPTVPTTPPPDRSATVPDPDCRPKAPAPRVRAVSPRVTRAVNHQWRRIERWLAANAPKSLRTLNGPARARTIAVAEAQMGLRFPNDLRASLLRHDGARVVGEARPFGFLGNGNQGVREIRDTWRRLCEIDGKDMGEPTSDADARQEWWDGRMIPFGADGSGNHLVIDSVVRDVGETDHEGQMSFTPGGVRTGSYYQLLKATANALETGDPIGSWRPVVVDGELDWDVTLG